MPTHMRAVLITLVALSQAACPLFPGEPARFDVGDPPGAIALADFDGDGTSDVVSVSVFGDLSVLPGIPGVAAFAAAVVTPGPPEPGVASLTESLAVADFDGDGALDVAIPRVSPHPSDLSLLTGDIRVFLGNGDGTFRAMPAMPLASLPIGIAAGDVDDDGVVDLVTVNVPIGIVGDASNGSVATLRGLGDGTFTTAIETSLDGFATSLAIGDLGGDARHDVVLTRIGEGGAAGAISASVDVFRGDGMGGLERVDQYPLPAPALLCRIADVDGDGALDVLALSADPTVSVLPGRGDGSLGEPTLTPIPLRREAGLLASIEVADVDVDGVPDLIGQVLGSAESTLAVMRGTGGGAFGPLTLLASGPVGRSMQPAIANLLAVEDVSGDGLPDLISAGTTDRAGAVSVLPNLGGGRFQAKLVTVASPIGSALGPRRSARADFDGDGQPDLTFVDDRSGRLVVLFGEPGGSFSTPRTLDAGSFTIDVATADVDHDGRVDLVATTLPESGKVLSVLRSNGDRTFAPPSLSPPAPASPALAQNSTVLGDLDRDGNVDAATVNGDSLTVALGLGDGTFAAGVRIDTGGSPIDVAVTDLDGDANPDLVGCLETRGRFALLGRGDGSFGDAVVTPDGGCFDLAASDLNGDGFGDVVTVDACDFVSGPLQCPPGAGVRPVVAVSLGRGDGTFEVGEPLPIDAIAKRGGVRRFVTIAPLDEDAAPDIALADRDGSQVGVFVNRGDGTFARRQTIPIADISEGPGDRGLTGIVAADFDGDGSVDLAVPTDSPGRIRLLPNLSPASRPGP